MERTARLARATALRTAALLAALAAGGGGCSLIYPFDMPERDGGYDEATDAPDVEAEPDADGEADADAEADVDVPPDESGPEGADGDEGGEEAGPVCGDGVVDPPEVCDTAVPVECTTTCGSAGTRACLGCTEVGETCTPPREICNGLDDDCIDGPDDPYACVRGAEVDCTTSCGTHGTGHCTDACDFPAGGDCTPPAELCDGFDDDCDGAADNGCACASRWAYDHPLSPGAESTAALSVTPEGHAFIVGSGGLILEYDGTAWRKVAGVPTADNLKGVSALSPTSAVAVGVEAASLWWDGSAWTYHNAGIDGDLTAVSALSATDAFACGVLGTGSGVIVRWDGTRWRPMSIPGSPPINKIRAVAADDVYAVGRGATLLHYDGIAWESVAPPGLSTELDSIWHSAPDDVWIGGSSGTIIRGHGRTWAPVPSGSPETFYGIWGSSAADVWVAGGWAGGVVLHCVDAACSPATVPAIAAIGIIDVMGTAADDIFMVGRSGGILHYDGVDWRPMDGGATVSLRRIWGTSAHDAYVLGDVYGPGDGNVILRYDGVSWTVAHWLPEIDATGLWASSPRDLFTAGPGVAIRRWDGASWSEMPSGVAAADLYAIWGYAGDAALAVGGEQVSGGIPVATRFNGTSWTPVGMQMLPDVDLLAVGGGASEGTVFAVGTGGNILRFQPTWPGAFFSVSSPVTATLRGVWAASSTNAFAVGDRGTIVHWDGSEWTRVDPGIWPPGTEPDLTAVWGSGPNNVFAVGDLATILRYDGSSWTQDYTEALTDFTGVWGSAANNVFIVGDDRTGTILHRCGQDW